MTLEEAQSAIEKMTASIEKLEQKNKELLTEKQKALQAKDDAETAASAAAEKAERESNNIEALEKRLTTKFQADIDKANQRAETAEKALAGSAIDSAISRAIVEHGFNPDLSDGLNAMFRSGAEYRDGEVYFGDTPFSDHVKTFAESDKGKVWKPFSATGGAGATGGKDAGPVVPDKWDFTVYCEMKSKSPELAMSYAKKHNQPFANS